MSTLALPMMESSALYVSSKSRKKKVIEFPTDTALKSEAQSRGLYRIPSYTVRLVRDGTKASDRRHVEESRDAFEALRMSVPDMFEGDREVLTAIYMDRKHGIIWIDPVFFGTIDGTTISNREIIKRALLCNAAAIIVGHNHPSGNPTPSSEDRQATQELKRACSLFDLLLLDHIIIGEECYHSMADKRQL